MSVPISGNSPSGATGASQLKQLRSSDTVLAAALEYLQQAK